MPEMSVEFEVWCGCGNGLCGQVTTRVSANRSIPQIVVEPCERCLDKARDEGEDDGYAQAERAAEQDKEGA